MHNSFIELVSIASYLAKDVLIENRIQLIVAKYKNFKSQSETVLDLNFDVLKLKGELTLAYSTIEQLKKSKDLDIN